MRIIDIIIKKRDNQILSKEELEFVIRNYTNGTIPDYQMSSLLMAIYFNGMTKKEATDLAIAMRDSGDVFDLSAIEGLKVDKHSTGGVGDKVTLVLAPLMAAVGLKFAKMSGRGLGHTGGTLDKLESIENFKIELTEEDFVKQVNEINLAVIGQSKNITPAYKLLYALRDVTGTVPSIPLIASSIMSKKLASGSDIICLDVKVGSGAFMQTIKEAEKLARLMVEIGALANKKVQAVLTNMDEPLGNNIGNSLEVIEAIETLNGEGPKDLETVTFTIGALLMEAANLAKGDEAIQLMKEKIATKEALNKLIEMVEKQGGNSAQIKNPDLFKKAPQIVAFKAEKNGYIEKMETEKIGLAAMVLGAGRAQKDDEIDHTVGLSFKKKIGAYVKKGDVIAEIHAQEKGVKEALTLLKEAIIIGNDKKTITLIEGIIK